LMMAPLMESTKVLRWDCRWDSHKALLMELPMVHRLDCHLESQKGH